MTFINLMAREINCKIVYYGPGLCGKTTNLELIYNRTKPDAKGKMVSLATETDRTLFFDYMPLDLGTVAGMRTCFQIYTVPGQVYYNSTRKLVLQGVDGVIFVADSSEKMREQNIESLKNLEENLAEYGKSIDTLPVVLQYNKRALPDAVSVETLEADMNQYGVPAFEAVANTGQGVFPTLKGLAAVVLRNLSQEHSLASGGAPAAAPPMQGQPVAQQPAPAPPVQAQPIPAQPVQQAQPIPAQPVQQGQPIQGQPVAQPAAQAAGQPAGQGGPISVGLSDTGVTPRPLVQAALRVELLIRAKLDELVERVGSASERMRGVRAVGLDALGPVLGWGGQERPVRGAEPKDDLRHAVKTR